MDFIKSVIKGIDTFMEKTGRILSWSLLTLIFFTCFEVFTRRIMGSPTIWTLEMSTFFACGVCMLALGFTELHKEHVNVDLFYIKFSPRTQAICDIITFVLFLGVFSLVLVLYGWVFFWDSWVLKERTASAFNAVKYPAKFAFVLGAFLLFIQGLSNCMKRVIFLKTGERI